MVWSLVLLPILLCGLLIDQCDITYTNVAFVGSDVIWEMMLGNLMPLRCGEYYGWLLAPGEVLLRWCMALFWFLSHNSHRIKIKVLSRLPDCLIIWSWLSSAVVGLTSGLFRSVMITLSLLGQFIIQNADSLLYIIFLISNNKKSSFTLVITRAVWGNCCCVF